MAKDHIRLLRDQTHPRETNVCYVNNQRLEITLRGSHFTNDPREIRFGEYFFYTTDSNDEETDDRHYQLLPISHDRLNTYSFFYGPNSLCDKAPLYKIKKTLYAIPLLKENNPAPEKLIIQLFNIKKMKPDKVIETHFLTNAIEASPKGFSFNHIYEKRDITMGKVQINGDEYLYHDQDFNYWINYSSKGFEISLTNSFDHFKWKTFFKDLKEFTKASGWDENQKFFRNLLLYHAINHAKHRECIYFAEERRPIKGSENWFCAQAI